MGRRVFSWSKNLGGPCAAEGGPGLAARLLVYSEDTNADDAAGIFADSALLCFENFRYKLSLPWEAYLVLFLRLATFYVTLMCPWMAFLRSCGQACVLYP